jgi:DNA-directed RNA polymerase specialized sigma54-like protein
MPNNLTLEMVAEKAGVSRSTVSRVVNNHLKGGGTPQIYLNLFPSMKPFFQLPI